MMQIQKVISHLHNHTQNTYHIIVISKSYLLYFCTKSTKICGYGVLVYNKSLLVAIEGIRMSTCYCCHPTYLVLLDLFHQAIAFDHHP